MGRVALGGWRVLLQPAPDPLEHAALAESGAEDEPSAAARGE
jgi:hypothetical protein